MNVRDVKIVKEHPDTLKSMNALASILRAQGRLWDTEELQVQVMELRRTKSGSSHPNTMASMNNLALIFNEQRKGEKAVDSGGGYVQDQFWGEPSSRSDQYQ